MSYDLRGLVLCLITGIAELLDNIFVFASFQVTSASLCRGRGPTCSVFKGQEHLRVCGGEILLLLMSPCLCCVSLTLQHLITVRKQGVSSERHSFLCSLPGIDKEVLVSV